MTTQQNEVRRLMKEGIAKQQQQTKKQTTAKQTPHTTAASSDAAPPKQQLNSSNASPAAVPAGFFDDSLADAKARNVDLKQLADTQTAHDWEQFQAFVAEVEQQDANESVQQQQDAAEKDALEQLEHMAVQDRYRIALERAAKLAALKRASVKRRASADNDDAVAAGSAAAGSIATAIGAASTTAKTAAAAVASNVDTVDADTNENEQHATVLAVLQQTRARKKARLRVERNVDEAFDPCNWRAKAL